MTDSPTTPDAPGEDVVSNIWDRPDFAGLSPDDRHRLAADGDIVRRFAEMGEARRRGVRASSPVALHQVLAAFDDSRSILEAATGRGVTVEQLADALGLAPQQVQILMPKPQSDEPESP